MPHPTTRSHAWTSGSADPDRREHAVAPRGHNEEANTFALAIVVLEEQGAALQLMAVAAPRSAGLWAEVMDELEAEIQQAGGTMTRGEGRFGPELSGQVPAQDPDGNQGMQVARFVGAEGNRWFVRGMFMGLAATSPAMGSSSKTSWPAASSIVASGPWPR